MVNDLNDPLLLGHIPSQKIYLNDYKRKSEEKERRNIPEKFKISQFRDGRCFTMMIKKPSNPGPAPPLRSETEGTQTEEAQRGVVREAEKPG